MVIGVDGGGTGCRARLADAQGRVLGAATGGPATVRLGIDRSMAAVEQACRAALAEARLPAESLGAIDAGIGLAGLGRKGALEQLQARPHPFRSVRYVDDATIACIGAHGGRDGGIVVVGTGSVGVAVVGGREIRVGGYGFPISDEGSGADLGLRAVRFALRANDGREPATGFTRAVMARFGNDPYEAVAWMDRATATDYAILAPLVMGHASDGDAAAANIVRKGARRIEQLVRWLIERSAPRVALVGGLAASMAPWLAPETQRLLSPVEGDAVDGALALARRAAAGSG